MQIYEYTSYKQYVKDWVSEKPKKGRGQWGKIAKHLGLSSVQVSQIFQAQRNLNPEQSYLLSDFLQLTDLESSFFTTLVEIENSSHHQYKSHLEKKLAKFKEESKSLKKTLPQDESLDENTKNIFYSDWVYSGVRLLCDIKSVNTVEHISNILGLGETKVRETLKFLLEKKLVVKDGNELKVGPKRIHLENDSSLAKYIHMNWRLKSLQDLSNNNRNDAMRLTVPCTSSKEDFEELQNDIREVLAKFYKKLPDSESTSMQCLCIDLFPLYSE